MLLAVFAVKQLNINYLSVGNCCGFRNIGKVFSLKKAKKKSRFSEEKRLLEGFLRKSDLLDYEDITKKIKKN